MGGSNILNIYANIATNFVMSGKNFALQGYRPQWLTYYILEESSTWSCSS